MQSVELPVTLNGVAETAKTNSTLAEQLITWGYIGKQPFVVAVNGILVPTTKLADTKVIANQKIDVVSISKGG